MAINVQYGPVAAALGLANQAGLGINRQRQQQNDQQFLGLVNDMQARADANHAREISQSLQEQSLSQQADNDAARLNLSATQNAAENALRAAGLNLDSKRVDIAGQNATSNDQYRQGQLDARQQTQQLQQTKFDTQQSGIDALPIDQQNIIRAQGHLPANGQDDSRLLIQEYRRLDSALRQAQKDNQAATYDPNDLKKILSEKSDKHPGAIKGMEAAFDSSSTRVAAIQNRLAQVQAALDSQMNQHMETGMAPATGQPAVSQQAIGQIIQQNQQALTQPAPGQTQPRILAQERNPQDGKMWGYDANQGRWIPLQ